MKNNWANPDLLPKKILFIDGITRSGKSMVGPVVSSLKKTYPFQHQAILDNLMPILDRNSISPNAVKALLTLYFNQNLYCLNISRQINLRTDDNSSILKNVNYKNFIKNLKKPEGDYVIREIKKRNYLPIYLTHDLLSMIDDFEKINLSYKLIYTYRHPIDNIFSLVKRYEKVKSKNKIKYNYNNPRIYSMMIKKDNILLPYYTIGRENYFLKLNHAEKYVFYYFKSLKKSITQYKKFKYKKKIMLIAYDEFAQNTFKVINKIANFLSLKKSTYTNKSLKIEKLPRKMNLKLRDEKSEILRKMINKKMYDEIKSISRKYEKGILF